jgi:hypothetical protein
MPKNTNRLELFYSERLITGLVWYANDHFVSGSGMVTRQSFENRTFVQFFEWVIGLDHFIHKRKYFFVYKTVLA